MSLVGTLIEKVGTHVFQHVKYNPFSKNVWGKSTPFCDENKKNLTLVKNLFQNQEKKSKPFKIPLFLRKQKKIK